MSIDRRHFLTAAAAGISAIAAARSTAAAGDGLPASLTIPLDLSNRRVTMNVVFNGDGPHKLVLDTGGEISLVDKSFADRLRLPVIGSRSAQRVGRVVKPRAIRRADELLFSGGLRQAGTVFLETDDVEFHDGAVGSLSAGMLTSVDSELDLQAGTLQLYRFGGPDRQAWHAVENAIVPPKLAGWSSHLLIEATLGDAKFRPLVDTGAPRGLLISRDLAKQIEPASDRWSPAWKKGDSILRTFRSRHPLVVGAITIANPVVIEDDLPAKVGQSAIIGLEYLRRLNLATDVKRKRVFVKSNANTAIPAKYNLSGLWVDRQGSSLMAGAVGKGSPAEAAGIRVGERLSGMTFDEMIAALNGEQGSTIALIVGKGANERRVGLTLVDYL